MPTASKHPLEWQLLRLPYWTNLPSTSFHPTTMDFSSIHQRAKSNLLCKDMYALSPHCAAPACSLCIEYEELIKASIKYRYPLPLVPAPLDNWERPKSSQNWVYVVPTISLELRRETNGTMVGQYKYCARAIKAVLHTCCVSVFYNDVLRNMLGKFVTAYVDNNLIYSQNCSTYMGHINQIFI